MAPVSQKKRGRPVKHDTSGIPAEAPAKSKRGRQNYVLMVKAYSVLRVYAEQTLPALQHRRAVMYELGRVEHPAALVSVAIEISQHSYSTQDAVALIRRMRLGNRPLDCFKVGHEIRKLLERYKALYPAMTTRDAEDACDFAVKFAKI